MSLTKSKMGSEKGSLKSQLEQEERDLQAELSAVKDEKVKVSKKEEKEQLVKEPKPRAKPKD